LNLSGYCVSSSSSASDVSSATAVSFSFSDAATAASFDAGDASTAVSFVVDGSVADAAFSDGIAAPLGANVESSLDDMLEGRAGASSGTPIVERLRLEKARAMDGRNHKAFVHDIYDLVLDGMCRLR